MCLGLLECTPCISPDAKTLLNSLTILLHLKVTANLRGACQQDCCHRCIGMEGNAMSLFQLQFVLPSAIAYIQEHIHLEGIIMFIG